MCVWGRGPKPRPWDIEARARLEINTRNCGRRVPGPREICRARRGTYLFKLAFAGAPGQSPISIQSAAMNIKRISCDPTRPGPQAPLSRRRFIRQLGQFAGAAGIGARLAPLALAADKRRPKVAAILTEFTYRSHAHVLLENFLEPYLFNGKLTSSGMDVAGLYVDQFSDRDMAREVAATYGIKIYPTIASALGLGGDALAVDGVLSIGEHGKYPINEKGQQEYPRKRFFDEIGAVFRRSGRVAPLYNDKHLSYRWDWAREMYDTARVMKIPFMAGSSVPLAERRPPAEIPRDARILQAVSIHSGPVESYDFHGLEVLQAMVESRHGAETGVARVQFLQGDAFWQAANDGLWSPELARAALATDAPVANASARDLIRPPDKGETGQPFVQHGILVHYRDGLSAIVLRVRLGAGIKWHFACRIPGEPKPLATSFHVGPWQNRNLFKALAHAIQTHIRERRAPYPIERTLLTTGVLAAAMDSRFQGGLGLDTPHLNVAYKARDFHKLREMGASWRIITEDVSEPKGIDPNGDALRRLPTGAPTRTNRESKP